MSVPVIQTGRARREGEAGFLPRIAEGDHPVKTLILRRRSKDGYRLVIRSFNPTNRKWSSWSVPKRLLRPVLMRGALLYWNEWIQMVNKFKSRFLVDPELETLKTCYDRGFCVAKSLVIAKRIADGKIKSIPEPGKNFDFDDRPKTWVNGSEIRRRRKEALSMKGP